MMSRFRETGLIVGVGQTGPLNSITDVPGVRVGHATLVAGHGELVVGSGPVRTGVTVILPHEDDPWTTPVYAGFHALNGCGEVTGVHWIRECGMLMSPVALTSTHSVGAVYEGLVRWAAAGRSRETLGCGLLPVVAETWDGILNDGFGMHVRPEHVLEAIQVASSGAVTEGNAGGGTGMVCHGFKGGIGTSSRILRIPTGDFTVGALVQANHGIRERLVVNGVPLGAELGEEKIPVPCDSYALGSLITVLATDAPLLPHQCRRMAQRAELAVGRLGGLGEHGSGDMSLAFSTANKGMPVGDGEPEPTPITSVTALADTHMDLLFALVVESVEEAILNALFAAETMVGRDDITAYALPQTEAVSILEGRSRG
jgi:D-aminopeptidase